MMIISGTNYLEKEFRGLPAGLKPITFPLYQDTLPPSCSIHKSPVAQWQSIKASGVPKAIGLTLVGSNWIIS